MRYQTKGTCSENQTNAILNLATPVLQVFKEYDVHYLQNEARYQFVYFVQLMQRKTSQLSLVSLFE